MEQWVTRGAWFCFSFFKMELLKHCLFVFFGGNDSVKRERKKDDVEEREDDYRSSVLELRKEHGIQYSRLRTVLGGDSVGGYRRAQVRGGGVVNRWRLEHVGWRNCLEKGKSELIR